jgi:hypothetical protein
MDIKTVEIQINEQMHATLKECRVALAGQHEGIELAHAVRLLKAERDAAVSAIQNCVVWANGREDEWGSRAENSFNFLHRFLEAHPLPTTKF